MSSDAPEALAAWLSDVANDPVRFVAEAFAWGEGELANSQGPEGWQTWVLEKIRDGLKTPNEPIKIAVASGHGVGKSALCAWVALWAISTRAGTRGIITASSESMLMTRLRAETKIWLRRFKAREFFELTQTCLIPRDPNYEQVWRVDLLAWGQRSETMAGLHSRGGRLLCIFDEASAIESQVWETLEPVTTDAEQCIWLTMGNPLHPLGMFKECWGRFAHRWITKHVDSRSVSFTNKLQLERWIQDYGEDSDFVRTRVKGEFPRVGSTQFIGPDLVQEAMDRELTTSRNDPLIIGVDVARFGDDESVIFPRRGMDARTFKPLTFRNIPLDKLEDHVVGFCNAHRVQQILCDGTGVGGGLVDHLRRRGYLVTDVQFGSRADQQIDGTRFANKRAEIWGLLRNALRNLCLPNNQVLKEQLTGPEYSFSRTSDAILLEPKEAMKRRGVPSPDLADALACTFGAEIATLPALSDWVQPNHVPSEYSPFSQAALDGRYADAVIGRSPRYYAPNDDWAQWSRMKPEYE